MATTVKGRVVRLGWLLESDDPAAVEKRAALPLAEWRELLLEYWRLREAGADMVAVRPQSSNGHGALADVSLLSDVMALDNWLTTEEAAELVGFHPEWIRDLARDGKVTARKFGFAWMIDRKSLLAYVAGQEAAGRKRGPKPTQD